MPGTSRIRVFQLCILALLGINAKAEFAVAQTVTQADSPAPSTKPSFGQLRTLNFKGSSGHYSLNGIDLPRVSSESLVLVTADQTCTVEVSIMKTVLISNGKPINPENAKLVQEWSRKIPRIKAILDWGDSIGSLKPVMYRLVEQKKQRHLHLREQLTVLWSADPKEAGNVGKSGFGQPMPFSESVVDIQYRSPNSSQKLFSKIFLQILYIEEQSKHAVLGGFVIVSKSSGEYEFYLVPMNLLNNIIKD